MKLLVVIVSYRVTDLTIDCLRSLSGEVGRCPGIRVAVCENGTGGDAEERLRRAIVENGWDSWVNLTAIYPNRGFTGGNNAVIRPALQSDDPPEYVLLLNADTTVEEHALDALVAFMDDHPRAGIAGSMLVAPDGTVESSPFRFPGDRHRAEPGPATGYRLETAVAVGLVHPQAGRPRACWVGLRGQPDPPASRARADRAAGRGVVHLLRRPGHLPARRPCRLGDVVRASQPSHPPGGGVNRRDRQPAAVAAPGLLVPGAAPVLPEELRSMLHGPGGRGVHPRASRPGD